MKKFFLIAAAAMGIAVAAPPALSQSLSDRLAAKQQAMKVELQVACGKLDKSNCAQVVPRLAEYSVSRGLTIKPIESQGSMESAQGLCAGLVDGAIGQRDAFDQAQRLPDCVGKFTTVGKALYPYYGYFVVRADAPFSTFDDMLSSTPVGKSRTVAAGKLGSGGQTTMSYILKGHPEAKRVISVQNFDESTSLQRIKDGSLDGYFVMDGPGSDLIENIKTSVDKSGKPLFKFLDLRLGSNFYYGTKGWDGKPLFQEVALAKYTFSSNVYTISVDAVMIVSNSFREDAARKGPAAVETVGVAIDSAEASIYGDTKTPRDWRPAGK
jgi:TRAP-type uncharacterized transport system substrate-binding protein